MAPPVLVGDDLAGQATQMPSISVTDRARLEYPRSSVVLLAQRVEDGRVHPGLDGAQGGAGLGRLGPGDLGSGLADAVLVRGAVDDGGGQGIVAAVPAAGGHGLMRGLRGEPGLDE